MTAQAFAEDEPFVMEAGVLPKARPTRGLGGRVLNSLAVMTLGDSDATAILVKAAMPEPTSIVLLKLGMVGLIGRPLAARYRYRRLSNV